MKACFIVAAATAIFGPHVAAQSASSPTLYIFGDSLSDVGTLKELTLGLVPPPPYWQGRFSSGPVWNEYLAPLLNYNLYNKAIGGSTSDNSHSSISPLPIKIPSSQDQINYFKLNNPLYSVSSTTFLDIAVLEIGANDYFADMFQLGAGTLTVDSFIGTLSDTVVSQLQQLKDIGFRNIVVTNLAAIQYTPMTAILKSHALANETVTKYNQMLAAKVTAWAQSANIGFFSIADIGGFVALTVNSAAITTALGITDTQTSCVGGNTLNLIESQDKLSALVQFFIDAKEDLLCSDPSTNYFFDPVHPAERVHRLFGYVGKEMVAATIQGQQFQLTESSILSIISKYNLGTPAPKPASV
ncbi:hypothetical protein GQ54DRAFT_320728 [Martensiomyces pterosporus]|nr:hypothetical protein GQ54DRAFT_320728 [Martensiomyces pterosporus]